MKRKVEELPSLQSPVFFAVKKQLRSKLPQRRRRFQISPILNSFSTSNNCSSHLTNEELSFEYDSSRASVNKRGFDEKGHQEFRRVTRANFSDKRINEWRENAEAEVSEYSCVESCSGAVSVDREAKLKRGVEHDKEVVCVERFSDKIVDEKVKRSQNLRKFNQNEVSFEGIEASETVNQSEISVLVSRKKSKMAAEKAHRVQHSLELNSNDVVPCNSGLANFRKASVAETVEKVESRREEVRQSDAERGEEVVPVHFDFTCSENFSNDIVSDDYSSAYSELQSEIFLDSSDFEFSDYTPSIWYDSSSQFSEKSNVSPSPTFQLFLQFSQEFCKSTTGSESNAKSSASFGGDDSHEVTLLGLEDKEDQESYKMIRKRERRQVYLHDYADDYCSATDCGDLIIQQRLQMVHWIFEQSTNKELQRETMFLGVSLLDRLLSKGYFKTKRNLQIAGIACLTLATRIEENQPFNSVRQKIFHIGNNPYSRCEVVAMEWLVQEVLNFQCFLPTIYNFLWFYLKAARASEKVEKIVKYLSVLALLGHEQLNHWPSSVAAALVILASIATNQEASCNNLIEAHARIKDDDLPECIKVQNEISTLLMISKPGVAGEVHNLVTRSYKSLQQFLEFITETLLIRSS